MNGTGLIIFVNYIRLAYNAYANFHAFQSGFKRIIAVIYYKLYSDATANMGNSCNTS